MQHFIGIALVYSFMSKKSITYNSSHQRSQTVTNNRSSSTKKEQSSEFKLDLYYIVTLYQYISTRVPMDFSDSPRN